MLNDITTLTTKIFDQFIPNNSPINSKKKLYDTYRAMQKLVDRTKLVSEHYLALDFTEGYLQDSSLGTPSDKWRYFFNKDLEELNKCAKKYLFELNHLAPKDSISCFEGYLSKIYREKTFYSYIKNHYNVGYVDPCGFSLSMSTLKLDVTNDSVYIEDYGKIDLSTFEQRVALRDTLREKTILLQNDLARLKKYIENNFVLDDLL